ncbi:MAG: large repetitive protein [Actinomycetota bacterium]|jgi:endonuclease/exonuclease/phosphatase family metal-dependent hydrolase|nr:large repetitive protein [Actinomycetota bacterium]
MRRKAAIVALGLLASTLHTPVSTLASAPPRQVSPGGQINIVTINAKQNRVLGINRFLAMFELGRALRFRPKAFDGGFNGSVTEPDVLVLTEFRASNLEIFERLLKQRFDTKYRIIGPADAAAAIIANTETVTAVEDPVRWSDVCTDADNPPDGRAVRDYQFQRFTEIATGTPFVVAGMHLAKDYRVTGQAQCLERNIQELRDQLAGETAATFVAGDFNKRAVEIVHECDPEEQSPSLIWWRQMTDPSDGGRTYVDAVREWHLVHGRSMADEWTHEQKTTKLLCDGSERFRRTRIDYIFSTGAVVAQASADAPGWAGPLPGQRNPDNYKYSDHRFVWGRFVISGPPQPAAPTTEERKDGEVFLTWQPVEGAVGYVLLRALADRQFNVLQRLPGETTSFTDSFTEDGRLYNYSIAAVGQDGGQGLESRNTTAIADSSGPHVIGVLPFDDARDVEVWRTIEVRFDEGVDPDSVTGDVIELTLGGRRVSGTVKQKSARRLVFNPAFPLKKGKVYKARTNGIRDRLGNRGQTFGWNFTTQAPPPKKHPRRR